MSEEIIIVGIVFGSVVAIVVLSLVSSLIKTSIKSKKGRYDDEAFHRMAQAFIQHKKDTERRLKNLEAIISGDDSKVEQSKLEEPERTIEIDKPKETKTQRRESNDGGLKNILKE